MYEKVVAYISLQEGYSWTDEMELEIRLRVSNKLSSIATPQDIRILDYLPKDDKGEVERWRLKEWYKNNELSEQ